LAGDRVGRDGHVVVGDEDRRLPVVMAKKVFG
jgi:hypothetical protein